MKKITTLAFLLITLAGVPGTSTHAQTTKRIQFAKGKASALVKGSTGKYGVTYVIRAKAGQKLVLDLTPAGKVGVKVETMGRFGEMVLLKEERGGHYEVGLEESGDYTIFIGSINHRSIPFTISVKVTRLSDI